MSRVGKVPIEVPKGVKVEITKDNIVLVKGKFGELQEQIDKDIKVRFENDKIFVSRTSDSKKQLSYHGLYRALIKNMVVGVSEAYKIQQELVGVGYKADNKGQLLELNLGFSHNIFFEIPKEVKIETKTERRSNSIITLTSPDKQLIGQVAAKIRSFRKPEPYKGKGVKFVGEELRKKVGKLAASS